MESNLKSPSPIGHVDIGEDRFVLSLGSYMNGRIAVMLHTKGGEVYEIVSKNIPDLEIDGDQFFVNWYNLSPLILDALSKCGFFEDTGERVRPTGSFVELPLWEMTSMITANYVTVVSE
jgi:hypothetical protein